MANPFNLVLNGLFLRLPLSSSNSSLCDPQTTSKSIVHNQLLAQIGSHVLADNAVINIADMISLLNKLETALHKKREKIEYEKDIPDYERSAYLEAHNYRLMQVSLLKRRAQFLLDIQQPFYPAEEASHGQRNKRFVATLIFFAISAIAATAMGAYTVHELTKIDQEAVKRDQVIRNTFSYADHNAAKADILKGLIDSTADLATTNHILTKDAEMMKREDAAINLAQSHIADMENIVTAALNQKLHPAAIEGANTNTVVQELKKASEAKGYSPLITRVTNLLQCRMSFIMDPKGMSRLVHVPTAPRRAFLEIYRFVPLPIPVHQKYHSLVDVKETLIAISSDDSVFRTFSPQELAECNKIGLFFACDKANVVRRKPEVIPSVKDDGMCMFALFLQKYEAATRVCNFKLQEAPPTVRQVSQTHFVSYNGAQHQGRITCSEKSVKPRSTFSANFITEVDLEPGCTATTDTHIFTAPNNGKVRDWTVKYTIPPLSINLGTDIDFDKFHQMRQQADHKLAKVSSFSVDEAARAWMEHKQAGATLAGAHASISITTIALAAAAIATLIGAAAYLRKKRIDRLIRQLDANNQPLTIALKMQEPTTPVSPIYANNSKRFF